MKTLMLCAVLICSRGFAGSESNSINPETISLDAGDSVVTMTQTATPGYMLTLFHSKGVFQMDGAAFGNPLLNAGAYGTTQGTASPGYPGIVDLTNVNNPMVISSFNCTGGANGSGTFSLSNAPANSSIDFMIGDVLSGIEWIENTFTSSASGTGSADETGFAAMYYSSGDSLIFTFRYTDGVGSERRTATVGCTNP